jgi:flagellar capping protein FliD
MQVNGGGLALYGLATGLDTGRIIEQLMQVESRGRVRVEWERELWSARRTGWQALQDRADALQQASRTLQDAHTWNDTARAAAAVEAWVTRYNELVDATARELEARRDPRAKTRAAYVQGALASDPRLYQVHQQVRGLVQEGTGTDGQVDTLRDIGIGRDLSRGAGSLASARLLVDGERLEQALRDAPGAVVELLAGTDAADPGVAAQAIELVRSWRSGGAIDLAIQGASQRVQHLQARIELLDERLDAKRARYEDMFAKLETAMGTLQQQQAWMAGQLGMLAR